MGTALKQPTMTQDIVRDRKRDIETKLITLFDAHSRVYKGEINGDTPTVRGAQIDRRESDGIGIRNTAVDQVHREIDRMIEVLDNQQTLEDVVRENNSREILDIITEQEGSMDLSELMGEWFKSLTYNEKKLILTQMMGNGDIDPERDL